MANNRARAEHGGQSVRFSCYELAVTRIGNSLRRYGPEIALHPGTSDHQDSN